MAHKKSISGWKQFNDALTKYRLQTIENEIDDQCILETKIPNATETLEFILANDEELKVESSKPIKDIDPTILLQLHLAGSNAQEYAANLVGFLL
jgi:hypothetical protein